MPKIQFTEDHIIIGKNHYDRKLIERVIALASNPEIENIAIDGFCGIGGVTEGFEQLENWMVIFCINHWWLAIETHQANHPDCIHLLEDFRYADLTIIKYVINQIKKQNPNVEVHLWLSLECTNFSNAKGGMSRDADSRTLADHADRYVKELNPDVIWIENVKEFMLWGRMIQKVQSGEKKKKQTVYVPKGVDEIEYYRLLIDNGHVLTCPLVVNKKKQEIKKWEIPDPNYKGEYYDRWKSHICSFGYDVEAHLFNCADFGVPQHRVRLIMQFNRKGVKAIWPAATHSKTGARGLPKWLPVRDCLDLEDEGESVLSFKFEKGQWVPRIESEATIDRLINGALKHVLPNRDCSQWIVKPNSAKNNTDVSSGASINESGPTVTCFNGLNLAKVHLVDYYFGNGYTNPIDKPAGVSGTKDGCSLHTLHFLPQSNPTQFLGTFFSTGNGSTLNNPSPSVTTKDKYPLFTTHFIDHQFSSGQKNKSIDEPCGALQQVPKQHLVEVERFIMDTQLNNQGHGLDEVARTQTANRKQFYLVNFQWFNNSFNPVSNPSNTIIARQDKSPNYLITLETGELAIEVFDYDPPHYVRLKKFMAEHGIARINMRMLKEVELLNIMTIPADTKLSKSSTANKKMIGNAVPSRFVKLLGAARGRKQYLKAA